MQNRLPAHVREQQRSRNTCSFHVQRRTTICLISHIVGAGRISWKDCHDAGKVSLFFCDWFSTGMDSPLSSGWSMIQFGANAVSGKIVALCGYRPVYCRLETAWVGVADIEPCGFQYLLHDSRNIFCVPAIHNRHSLMFIVTTPVTTVL